MVNFVTYSEGETQKVKNFRTFKTYRMISLKGSLERAHGAQVEILAVAKRLETVTDFR